jgi:hypothetical protein
MRLAGLLVLMAVAAIAAWFVETVSGTTRYRLNGADYAVPHRYEFTRRFHLPWLDHIRGLGRQPEASVMLLLPAGEIASGVPGYSRLVRGYVGPVEAGITVEVTGDADRSYFSGLHARGWGHFDDRMAEGVSRRPEPTGGERLVFSEGPPEQGNRTFYLLPPGGDARPGDRTPSYCLAAPDSQGRETYHCGYCVHQDGLTFTFDLSQENLGTAGQIPAYVRSRLEEWRPRR